MQLSFSFKTGIIVPHTQKIKLISHFQTRSKRCQIQRDIRNAAKRKCLRLRSQGVNESEVTSWLEFAFPKNEGFKNASDPELKAALNEICTMCIKAMLADNAEQVSMLKEDLYTLGEFFSSKGNNDAAMFVYILYEITQHSIPKQTNYLKGIYKDAFLKVASVLEDSGWQLNNESEEEENGSAVSSASLENY